MCFLTHSPFFSALEYGFQYLSDINDIVRAAYHTKKFLNVEANDASCYAAFANVCVQALFACPKECYVEWLRFHESLYG